MADHQNGHAGALQRLQDLPKGLLELRIQPLGRLVQQQDIRIPQQQLGQRGPLLLSAGKIIGVAVQKLRQAAQGDHPLQRRVLPLCPGQDLQQILPDGGADKQRLRILRQHAHGPPHLQLAPPGLFQPGQQLQAGGLAGAVAPQKRQQLSPAHLQRKALHHIRPILIIFEPKLPGGDQRFRLRRGPLLRKRLQRVRRRIVQQPAPPVPHGDRAGRPGIHSAPDPHGGRHGKKHGAAGAFQRRAHLCWRPRAEQRALFQNGHPGGKAKGLLQPMLRQNDRGAQLPVDPGERRQKIRSGDGVQLAGGLVQNEHAGLQRHDGRQIQKLLLAAGKLCHIFVEPGLDPKKGRHFRHPAADGGRIIAQALQPEGQLMPDLIRHQLIFRALLDEADALRLLPLGKAVQRSALQQQLACPASVGRQNGLQLPQQRAFAAAGGAAEHQKLALLHRQRKGAEGRLGLFRIGKGQVPDRKELHLASSFQFSITGVRQRQR